MAEGNHIQYEIVAFDTCAMRSQRFGSPGSGVPLRSTADVVAAELLEVLVVVGGGGAGFVLSTKIHESSLGGCGL